jgi:hypothetical protein
MSLLDSGDIPPERVPEPGAPESLLVLQQELKGLSLQTEFRKAGHGVSCTVRPASSEEVLSWSSGKVQNPELIDWRTLDEEPGGIYCPEVFGSSKYARRQRLGHIALEVPVISLLLNSDN